jgi:hypothetical protein
MRWFSRCATGCSFVFVTSWQPHLTYQAHGKVAPKFYGPFQVLEHNGVVAYKLALPPHTRIRNVFHMVFLKKFNGVPPTAPVPLPPIKHGCVLPLPKKVLRAHLNYGMWEIMVKWAGQADAIATWEKGLGIQGSIPLILARG